MAKPKQGIGKPVSIYNGPPRKVAVLKKAPVRKSFPTPKPKATPKPRKNPGGGGKRYI